MVSVVNKAVLVRDLLFVSEDKALSEIGAVCRDFAKGLIVEQDIVDTGRLLESMDFYVDMAEKAVFVGTPLNYGVFNELGTYKMAARPFLTPAVVDNAGVYEAIARGAFENMRMGEKDEH